MPGPEKSEEPKTASPSAPRGGRFGKSTRSLVVGLVIALVTLFILWHALLPTSFDAIPQSLNETDRREIARTCRVQTIRLSLDKLKRGEFKSFAEVLPKLFRQRIFRFIMDRDGTCRAYVGYADEKSDDGYADLWRHQLTKTNGYWEVIRSY